jgi:hypothetical protein
VGGDLDTGVAGADHHEGAPGVALGLVAERVGQLDLPGDVVAQVQRLGDAPEPVRVLADTRDGQQLVHTAYRDHQAVVAQLEGLVLRRACLQPAVGQVHLLDLAQHAAHPGQLGGQRHRDSAGLQYTSCHLGQQR